MTFLMENVKRKYVHVHLSNIPGNIPQIQMLSSTGITYYFTEFIYGSAYLAVLNMIYISRFEMLL